MHKNSVLKFWQRQSSVTYIFDESPVKEFRLDLISGGKTAGCIVGTSINVKSIISKGGVDLLRQIFLNDSLLSKLNVAELLTGKNAHDDTFDGQWLPSISAKALSHNVEPDSSNVLFIQMIEANRFFRGTGIAHHLLQKLCSRIGDGYPIVMLEAYPVDYQLNMTDQELFSGAQKLEQHYGKMGFSETGGGAMVACSQALAAQKLKSLCSDWAPPQLKLASSL